MKLAIQTFATALIALAFQSAAAFDSGSTGADGAFNPSASVAVQLPPSGVFNFTTVNVPSGVTVTFLKNAANSPVTILASGNVTIYGTMNVSGGNAATNTNYSNDGEPGAGGPGGYGGGRGGSLTEAGRAGGFGLGPGGGGFGQYGSCFSSPWYGGGGAGGGFAASGANGSGCQPPTGGSAYGSSLLQPLLGGSGGGGGAAGTTLRGTGGGGGGGAILIASSGTVDMGTTGTILANGGNGGSGAGVQNNSIGCGGGGSGGAIRIVANAVTGSGILRAVGGTQGTCTPWAAAGGAGAAGRIRIEAPQASFSGGSSSPIPSVSSTTTALVLAGIPSLRISSVAGVAVPQQPGGTMDVTLPVNTPNPVTVAFEASGVPLGANVTLTVAPPLGALITLQSTPLSGAIENSTATASVSIPAGHSVMVATVSYTVVASLGDSLKNYANNERVEKVTLIAGLGEGTKAKLTTISGKEYEVSAQAFRIAAAGR